MILLTNVAQTIVPNWGLVCIGGGGALAIQLLYFLEHLKLPEDKKPNLKKVAYWVPYFINPVLGAFLVYVYLVSQNFPMSAYLSLHVGASAPLILRAMANAIPHDVDNSLKNPSRR